MLDVSNYDSIRDDSRRFYERIGKIPYPAFRDELVHFTSEGFDHLIYKAANTERSRHDQIVKFKQLPRATELVRLTTTYQEYDETLNDFWVKQHKKRVRQSKIVKYWGLIAIIRGSKIKVIIRQVGDGQKHFWSVIPNWTTSQYRDVRLISRMNGNPGED